MLEKQRLSLIILAVCLSAGVLIFMLSRNFRLANSSHQILTKPAGIELSSQYSPGAAIDVQSSSAILNPAIAQNSPAAAGKKLPGRYETLDAAQKLAYLRELARTNPQHALKLAAAEQDEAFRKEMLLAVLYGWGQTEPEQAADWALSQKFLSESAAAGAIFQGAAINPAAAEKAADYLIRRNPEYEEMYGALLTETFRNANNYKAAAAYALAAVSNYRDNWVEETYDAWADSNPAEAAASAVQIESGGTRGKVFESVVRNWAEDDVQSLLEYAREMAEGPNRDFAFAEGMQHWVNDNAEAARQWLDGQTLSPQLDPAIKEVATHTPFIQENPAGAAGWAAKISAATIRSSTLYIIIAQWAAQDPDAAMQYLVECRDLTTENRRMVLQQFQHLANPNTN